MNRWFSAVSQFLPPRSVLLTYWGMSLFLIVLAGMGLEETGEQEAALWGLPLRGFGGTSRDILQNAYREMMCHAWTLVTLPFVTFFGMGPLVRSFRRDFVLFLRYSRCSRLFIEAARLGALLAVMVLALVPFAAGAVWGLGQVGSDWRHALQGMAACGGCAVFLCTLIYLLAALAVSVEVTIALSLVTPFFLTGLLAYLKKLDFVWLTQFLPPGLPYSAYDVLPGSQGLVDPNVGAGIVFALSVAGLRLAEATRTCWLVAPWQGVENAEVTRETIPGQATVEPSQE